MSYILDALKKADAERALGVVPGLHARAMPALPGRADASAGERALRWAGATSLLVAASALVWQLIHAQTTELAELALLPVEASANKAAPEQPKPVPRWLPEAPATGSPPAALAKAPEAGRTKLDLKLEKNFESLPPVRDARSDDRRDARSVARIDERARHRSEGSGIETLSQLPEHIRRELPVFSIGGSIYSENPADRLLIVNGRIYHEGDELTPGLNLEQMLPNAAVLRYKNYRYRLPF